MCLAWPFYFYVAFFSFALRCSLSSLSCSFCSDRQLTLCHSVSFFRFSRFWALTLSNPLLLSHFSSFFSISSSWPISPVHTLFLSLSFRLVQLRLSLSHCGVRSSRLRLLILELESLAHASSFSVHSRSLTLVQSTFRRIGSLQLSRVLDSVQQ